MPTLAWLFLLAGFAVGVVCGLLVGWAVGWWSRGASLRAAGKRWEVLR